jgi:hypothetical protein
MLDRHTVRQERKIAYARSFANAQSENDQQAEYGAVWK